MDDEHKAALLAAEDYDRARWALIRAVSTARARKQPLPDEVVEALFELQRAASRLAGAEHAELSR